MFKVISRKSGFMTICAQHFKDWFPDLPSYQAFNGRLNELVEPLKVLVFELIATAQENEFFVEQDSVIDSVPIM